MSKGAVRAGSLAGVATAVLATVAGCAPTSGGAGPAPAQAGVKAQLVAASPAHLLAGPAGGYASAVDDKGRATFVFASPAQKPPASATHLAAARFHASRFAPAMGLPAAALAVTEPRFLRDHDTSEGAPGPVIVHLGQRVGGVRVHRRELRLLMRPDHALVAVSGKLHPTISPASVMAGGQFRRPIAGAAALAISAAAGHTLDVGSLTDSGTVEGDDRYFTVAEDAAVAVPEQVLVRQVLFPAGDELLRPAWMAAFYLGATDSTSAHAWQVVVADDDGSVLEKTSLTQYDTFNFRVFVQGPDLRPADGPMEDTTPHPSGHPDWTIPRFTYPQLVSTPGFNRNPMGQPDPWLASAAVDTQGNNADAYLDRFQPDGFTSKRDFRAALTGDHTFDRSYNLLQPPTVSDAQSMAGIVQAFYVSNWMHDYWYDSGFNEAAFNAQSNNYSRGGVGHDNMKLESQDFSGRDNSNMSTPPDGMSPKMQIYVWTGTESRTLHIDELNSNLVAGTAVFGPDKFDLSGEIVEVNDGVAPSFTDACDPIQNDVSGKIALIDRGNCTFKRKAVNAQDAGAIGVILVNNTLGDTPQMGNGDPMNATVTLGILSTSKPAGQSVRGALALGTTSARLARVRDVDRDGSLDDSVLFHEWGHYLHHRASDCNNTQQCGAMSEGWADFVALHTVSRESDDLNGTYALASYASAQYTDPAYFGIRRMPYSVRTDDSYDFWNEATRKPLADANKPPPFNRNGLTLRHISDGELMPTGMPVSGGGANSEVHNAGEVWSALMWQAYVRLQQDNVKNNRGLSFERVRRKMADYVVAGLQLTPTDATYLEQRDAIIAAAGASSADDQKIIAAAFAERGAGRCAEAPPRTSQTLKGVVEDFDTLNPLGAHLAIGDVTLDDSAKSCDHDGILDAGETGQLVVKVINGTAQIPEGTTVTLSTSTAQARFVGATTFGITNRDPFAETTFMATIALDPSLVGASDLVVRIQPSAGAACANSVREVHWKVNYDVGTKSSRTEDWSVDALEGAVWTAAGGSPDDNTIPIWERVPADSGGFLMRAPSLALPYDAQIESPDLVVSKTDFFVIRFTHRYSFKALDYNGMRLYLDGGVVELSEDPGVDASGMPNERTWVDISQIEAQPGLKVQPGYNSTVSRIGFDNPIEGQRAFVDKNTSYPKQDEVVMNLLDRFAGKTVRIRFRATSVPFTPDAGWEINSVTLKGIDNTPFTGSLPDHNSCALPPSSGCQIAPSSPLSPLLLLLSPLALLFFRRRRRA